jgi:hypothetical protein
MSSFAPRPILTPYHFEIVQNERGYWIAKDKEGLVGGVFLTQKDALRFALFEVAGDSACVRILPADGARSTEFNDGVNPIDANATGIQVNGRNNPVPKTGRENRRGRRAYDRIEFGYRLPTSLASRQPSSRHRQLLRDRPGRRQPENDPR